MIRHLAFVLLLATGIALANERASGAAEAQAKTEAAQKRAEHVKAQTAAKEAKAETNKNAQALIDKDAEAQTDKDAEPKKDEGTKAESNEEAKVISVPGGKALGMSILGNQEAPKSLVIVPWKSSQLGSSPDISPMLDDSRQPVDKEVFMRALRYYEIRSENPPPGIAAGARR